MAHNFKPPTSDADGVLKLEHVGDYDPAMIEGSPPGVIGIYTEAGRHFSVVIEDPDMHQGDTDGPAA